MEEVHKDWPSFGPSSAGCVVTYATTVNTRRNDESPLFIIQYLLNYFVVYCHRTILWNYGIITITKVYFSKHSKIYCNEGLNWIVWDQRSTCIMHVHVLRYRGMKPHGGACDVIDFQNRQLTGVIRYRRGKHE